MTTKPLPTGARLAIGYGAAIFLMIALILLAAARAGQVDGRLGRMDMVGGTKQRYAFELRSSVRERAIALRDVVLAPNAAAAAAPISRIKNLDDAYARAASPLDALLTDLPDTLAAEKEALAAIREQERRTRPLVERVLALHAAGQASEAASLLAQQAAPAFVDWLASTTRFIELQEKLADEDLRAARALASSLAGWLLLLAAAAVTLAAAGAWHLLRGAAGRETAHVASAAMPESAPPSVSSSEPAVLSAPAPERAAGAGTKPADDIMGAIDGLAFQASILALDAAVGALYTGAPDDEAASVTQDLRALALRAGTVARDIRAFVASPAAHAEDAAALEGIAAAVARVTATTAAIGAGPDQPPPGGATRLATALLRASTAAAAMEAEASRLARLSSDAEGARQAALRLAAGQS